MILALLAAAGLLMAPLAQETAFVPDSGVVRLDEIGLYRVGWRYHGKSEAEFPVGWSGFFDDTTGVACQPVGTQSGRSAFLLHSPWRGGYGIAFQEYCVDLPAGHRATLTGAMALRSDMASRSDGVMFRVLINGQPEVDALRTDAIWKTFSIDLTAHAGHRVTIRFEVSPGEKNDPSFDYSYWGDRTLSISGYHPRPVRPPAAPPLDVAVIAAQRGREAAPPGAYRGNSRVTVNGGSATLRYRGPDGAFTYCWQTGGADTRSLLGSFHLTYVAGAGTHRIPDSVPPEIVWSSPPTSYGPARLSNASGAAVMTRRCQIGAQTCTITARARLVGKSLVLDISADRAVVKELRGGSWGPFLRRRPVVTPYYSGTVFYLPTTGLFVNGFLDWTASAATSHDGLNAVYQPLTDGTRRALRERVVFAPARHMLEALPVIPNAPSPYRAEVGRRVVLDTWGGKYDDIAADLTRLAEYGIRDTVSIIHVWQRSGYDNALPAHLPADASLGGDPAMSRLVAAGRKAGSIMALHENYVDYYPNYEKFDASHIALDSRGERVLAWYNMGTKIQSFAVQPNAILPLARSQSPEIHRRFGTNGCYLDVHSAVAPWFHVDQRATEPGSGRFDTVFDTHRRLWQYERETHGGPVLGEGNTHWYWSGMLDGVEAQFGTGWPGTGGTTAPLAVDFDLTRIHPLQINHGVGYYERWIDAWPSGGPLPMEVLDRYRMQEVAYGHTGFLGGGTWNMLPLAWLEHHLLTPVTARSSAARVASLSYSDGARVLSTTDAAIARAYSRPTVTYTNGLTVTCNGSRSPMRVGRWALPQFGWIARGAGVTAGTIERDGTVCDFAETPDSTFVNARNPESFSLNSVLAVRPRVAGFVQQGPRAFAARYTWTVGAKMSQSYTAFVHFSTEPGGANDEGIRFQQDHGFRQPTDRWEPDHVEEDGPHVIRVPSDLADGDYSWSIGLIDAAGHRAAIDGPRDRTGRVILGTLHVRGDQVTFTRNADSGPDLSAMFAAHLNTKSRVIDFGTVRTNASVLVRRVGQTWSLIALPRSGDAVIELAASRFGRPAAVRCVGGNALKTTPIPVGRAWRLRLNGAREYRWPVR